MPETIEVTASTPVLGYSGTYRWPADVPWPTGVTATIIDHGEVTQAQIREMRGPSYRANPWTADQPYRQVSSLETGRVASLSQVVDLWREYRPARERDMAAEPPVWDQEESHLWYFATEGKGSRGHETREDALAHAAGDVAFKVYFWADKIAWKANGDRTTDRYRSKVARVGGTHYVLRDERTPEQGWIERSARGRDHLGMGGRRLAFEFLDGPTIFSDNVWYQGVVPVELRELLPDNARMSGVGS